MAWAEIIFNLIGDIAWPATVLVVLLVFRGPLRERLQGLLEVEGAGLKAKFGQKLDHAEDLQEVSAAIDHVTAGTPLSADQDALSGLSTELCSDRAALAGHLDGAKHGGPAWLNVPSPKDSWVGPLLPSDRAAVSGMSLNQVGSLIQSLDVAAEVADVSPKAAATLAWGVLRSVVVQSMRKYDAQRVSDLIPLLRVTPIFSRSDAALLRAAEELVEYPQEAWDASDNGGPRFVRLVDYLIDRLLLAQSSQDFGLHALRGPNDPGPKEEKDSSAS